LTKRLADLRATANGNRSLLQRKNQALGQAEVAKKIGAPKRERRLKKSWKIKPSSWS
jgi:hypothetical protein